MNSSDHTLRYRTYFLRIWQEQPDLQQGHSTWRFSLEDPATHQRRGFATLEELFIFLEDLMKELA